MEDLPTLHGPRNKAMGLEVISPSAQFVTKTDIQWEGLRKIRKWLPWAAIILCITLLKAHNILNFSNILWTHCAHNLLNKAELWLLGCKDIVASCSLATLTRVLIFMVLAISRLRQKTIQSNCQMKMNLLTTLDAFWHPDRAHAFSLCTTRRPWVLSLNPAPQHANYTPFPQARWNKVVGSLAHTTLPLIFSRQSPYCASLWAWFE